VNTIGGQANVNGEQPPRVALVPKVGLPGIIVVWTAKGPDGTLLLTTRSDDGGRTFAPGVRVAGSEAPGNRGWEAIAVDAAGRVNVVWLDHRALATDGGRMAMAITTRAMTPPPDGLPTASRWQQSKSIRRDTSPDLKAGIYRARSPAASVTAARPCVVLAIATSLAWRHVPRISGIAFAISRDAGKTFEPPVRVSEDKWQLKGVQTTVRR
jgi:hypothetical protein